MSIADEEQFILSGTTRLWTTVRSNGTPILFFNGGPGCDDYLEPVAKLINTMYRVIRFEPRGCGRSDWDRL
ncbi:MAG: alpha/beta hydrolase [Caldilineaceae bacterium]